MTVTAEKPTGILVSGAARAAVAALLLLLAAGCATRPETPVLDVFDPDAGYRYTNLMGEAEDPENSEDLFVIVSISGGGTRAAALGFGMLEQLRDRRIVWNGREKSLLDEVDVIAGTSSGAVVAAYYAAFGDRIFEEFPDRFLYRNVSRTFKLRVANPLNLLKIASSRYGRTELAEKWYDDKLFHGATFGDLLEKKTRPYLVIGATDLNPGWSFPFTQARFDAICADLSRVKLARAVAASSAFPALFSSVTIENRAGSCGYHESPEAEKILADLRKTGLPRNRRWAEVLASYRDVEKRRYPRLQDGGLVDNLGLKTALEALEYGQGGWRLQDRLASGKIRKLVIVTVDASTANSICDETVPDDADMQCDIWAATGPPLNNQALDTSLLLEEWLARAHYSADRPDTYLIRAGIREIEGPLRERFNSMPTDLNLPRADVNALREIAGPMLAGLPLFGQLIADLQEPAIVMAQ